MAIQLQKRVGNILMRYGVLAVFVVSVLLGGMFVQQAQAKGEKGTVAISNYSLNDDFNRKWIEYATKVLEYEGYEVISHDPQGDTNAQVRDWEAWITSGELMAMSYYILNPSIGETTLMKAHAAGIKLIAPEPVDAEYVDNCQAEDNFNLGYKVGTAAGKWMQQRFNGERKKVVVVTTEMEIHNTRANGVMAAIRELYPNVEFLRHQGSGQIEKGYNEMANILTAHPDAKILVHYASDSYGAYQAMVDAGMDPKDPDAGIFNFLLLNSNIPLLEQKDSVFRAGFGPSYVDIGLAVASMIINAVEGGPGVPIHFTWFNPPPEDVFRYF